MSVTGIALILFLTFHCAMNIVALFSGEAYNMICELLGANWYAVVATIGLAALAVIHIVFAFILTAQNRTARGNTGLGCPGAHSHCLCLHPDGSEPQGSRREPLRRGNDGQQEGHPGCR